MNKKPFYREQADKFRDYASKFPDRDLLSLFDEWCESKDIFGKDKHEIWRIARRLRPAREIEIKENSEEFVRVSAVLDMLLQADLKYLNELLEKKRNDENKLDKT